jgi:hypothetical protein
MHATRVEAIPHLDQEQAGKERRISDIPNPSRARPVLRKDEIAAAAAPRPLDPRKAYFLFLRPLSQHSSISAFSSQTHMRRYF